MPNTNSVAFNGTSNYGFGNQNNWTFPVTNSYTVEFWVKPAAAASLIHFAHKGDRYQYESGFFVVKNEANLEFGYRNANVTYGGSVDYATYVPTGSWTHLCLTFDYPTRVLTLYVNGVQVAQTGTLAQPPGGYTVQPFRLATVNVENAERYEGLMDEVRIWSVCRTPTQVAYYWNKQAMGTETGLYGLYRLNATGTNFNEVTASGGTPSLEFFGGSFTWPTDVPPTTDSTAEYATQIVAPASDTSVGTWTTDTGATTNLYTAIDEPVASDADYIQSVAGPANAVYEAALRSVTDPVSSVGHTLPVRAWLDTAGPPATITGELRQGANALSTPVSFTDTITTTPTTYDDTLSAAQADAITNYGDLRLRLTANQPAVAPTFVSATAGAVGTTGQLNVSWPSYAVGDIGLLFIERAAGDPAPTFAAAAGFVAVTGAAVTTAGTGAVGTRLHTFWCRATSTGMGTVGINGSTDHQYAVMLVFRSCIATGDPWDVLATNFKISAGTPNTHPRVTTTVPNALIVCASGRDNDANNGIFSAQLNAGLTGVAERFDNGSNTGGGGGIGVWTGLKVAAGDTGETTSTMTSGLTANLTIALKPVPPASRVRVSWANLVTPASPGAAPLVGTAVGRATPTALLTGIRVLTAASAGVATLTAVPTRRRPLVGGTSGTGGASGTVGKYTARWLTGSAAGRATPSALVTRRRPVTGTAVGQSTATGAIGVFLRPVRELTGAATGKGTVGTDFKWGNGQLYGAASTIWGATGVTIITGGPPPPGPKNLYATADGVSVTTASPTRRRPLVAATTGTAVTTAAPTRRRPLIAASAGSATVTVTLSKVTFRNLAGLAVGTSTTTATLSKSTVFRNIAGLAVGASSTTAAPTRRRSLVVASVGTSAVTVALTRRRALVAASVGVATVTAAPGRKRVLVASAVGLSSTTAAVSAKRRLVAASAGAATTLASVDIAGSIYRALFGASVGRATNTGQTTRRRALIAASVGVSVTSGSPTRRRSMTVSALGRATVTAVPSRKLAMVALSAGRATVIAIPTRRRPLIAVSVGQATTTGVVDIITIPLTSVIWVVDHFEQGVVGTLVLWDTSVFQTSGEHAQVIWEEDVFKVYP